MSKPFPAHQEFRNFEGEGITAMKISESHVEGPVPKERDKFNCETHGSVDYLYLPKYETMMHGVRGEPAISHRKIKVCKTCSRNESLRLIAEQKDAEKAESILRAEKIMIGNIEDAGVSARNVNLSLSTFKPINEKQEHALTIANKILSDLIDGSTPSNLILTGSVGTGKTMLSSGMVADCIRSRKSAQIWKVIEIVRALKDTWRKDSERSETKLIEMLIGLDLLVIDEIGVQFGSDTEKMFIFEVIDGRYNKVKPTVLISNLPMTGIKECIGDRCVDRLREDGGKVVAFDFESQRGKK